jgi:glycosyltransferase involved in cell wall biosynthesis
MSDDILTTTEDRPWPADKWRATDDPRVLQEEGGMRTKRAIAPSQPRPLISYLTVVKNRCHTIGATLDSVAAEANSAVEHIVIDGVSSDGTLDIIRSRSASLEYYVSKRDRNLYDAINYGIELCRGAYICVINSDDKITKGSTKKIIQDFRRSHLPNTIFLYSAWKTSPGKKNKLWRPRPVSLGDYFRCTDVCHNAAFIPKALYYLIGPYNDSYPIAADSEWFLRASESGAQFVTSYYPACYYATTGLSSNGKKHWEDCAKIVKSRFPFLSTNEIISLLGKFYSFVDNIPQEALTGSHGSDLEKLQRDQRLSKFLGDAAATRTPTFDSTISRAKLRILKAYWRATQ